jgi:hypothetical protein
MEFFLMEVGSELAAASGVTRKEREEVGEKEPNKTKN